MRRSREDGRQRDGHLARERCPRELRVKRRCEQSLAQAVGQRLRGQLVQELVENDWQLTALERLGPGGELDRVGHQRASANSATDARHASASASSCFSSASAAAASVSVGVADAMRVAPLAGMGVGVGAAGARSRVAIESTPVRSSTCTRRSMSVSSSSAPPAPEARAGSREQAVRVLSISHQLAKAASSLAIAGASSSVASGAAASAACGRRSSSSSSFIFVCPPALTGIWFRTEYLRLGDVQLEQVALELVEISGAHVGRGSRSALEQLALDVGGMRGKVMPAPRARLTDARHAAVPKLLEEDELLTMRERAVGGRQVEEELEQACMQPTARSGCQAARSTCR